MNIRSSRVYSAPVPKMPPGLVELMEGLAREVLKNNPTEVYEFCAEHMHKLLQIRDGPTTKVTLTLKQKIAKATTKIRNREAQRRDEFDKKMQLLQHVQNDQYLNDNMVHKNDIEAEQYIQENIVKIPQNHLTSNIEHELIVGATQVANIINITTSDLKPEDNIDLRNESQNVKLFNSELDKINKIEEESSEIKLIEGTDDNGTEEKCFENNDKLTICVDDQNERKVLKDNTNFDEQTDLNASKPKNIEDSDITVVDVNNDNKINLNILTDNTESIDGKETNNALNGIKNSSTAINLVEHKDLSGNNDNIPKDKHEEEEKNYKVEDTTVETTEEEKTSSIDKNIISNDIIVKENNLEGNSDEITESVNKQNLNTNVKVFDEPTEGELKNKYAESHGHVNNNSMDLETAAITIQKVFRSFLFRNKTSSIDDSANIYMNLLIEDKEKKDDEVTSNNNIIKDRRSLGISRMDTVLQTVNEEKSLSLSTDDSSTLSSAATIIQAHVRGFLVRNNFNLNKTASSTSGIDSDAQSMTSLEGDVDCRKNRTVLNIHIVPEGGHYMSRDESMLTSIDLSLDGSPPNSTNLHPLGYDKSERRKQLKREDAIQSISPPSNNSGKLSEDVDSVKEVLINSDNDNLKCEPTNDYDLHPLNINEVHTPTHVLNDDNIPTMINNVGTEAIENNEVNSDIKSNQLNSLSLNSDEMDVVTPFVTLDETVSSDHVENDIKLINSGECHDVVLPTKVSRNDTSVVREFQNVVVYFLVWNNS
ncbi:protein PF3D7_1417600-like isoform X1 [Vanessa tameamea]|uniref:Protein PF3D7_1417600-like isoform X1 n=1 Tax=Vanessa tameamea TaxID=334116 RepID=A0A8B8IBI8_VANTA